MTTQDPEQTYSVFQQNSRSSQVIMPRRFIIEAMSRAYDEFARGFCKYTNGDVTQRDLDNAWEFEGNEARVILLIAQNLMFEREKHTEKFVIPPNVTYATLWKETPVRLLRPTIPSPTATEVMKRYNQPRSFEMLANEVRVGAQQATATNDAIMRIGYDRLIEVAEELERRASEE